MKSSKSSFLSKSRFLLGLQCHKLLWHHYNAKELLPPTDPATQRVFDQGHKVGELAWQLFPSGVLVDADYRNIPIQLAETQRLLASSDRPVFEAAFMKGNLYARPDILEPNGDGTWNLVEVKSATEVKEYHIHDVAFQRYVCESAGLSVRDCFLLHINTQYVRKGEIDPSQLFTRAVISCEVADYLPHVEPHVEAMRDAVSSREVPDISIGAHCDAPFECALHSYCWAFLPDDNITTIRRLRDETAFETIHQGILDVRDIVDLTGFSDAQRIQIESVWNGQPHIDRQGIRGFLESLVYPLHFLDFESFQLAVPPYNGTRPYQQIPFQFSLHLFRKPGSDAEHVMYLADGVGDSRPDLLKRLSEQIEPTGSIVAYHAAFEKMILDQAVRDHPRFSSWWESVRTRVVDLHQPFSALSYYHPAQRGSTSLKAVLPVLTNIRYDDLEIADGLTAANEYTRAVFGDTDKEERERIFASLRRYCTLDTEAMLAIVRTLQELA